MSRIPAVLFLYWFSMRWRPILYGVLFMLMSAYLDNSRGPLMPTLTHVLGLGYTQVSWMLVTGFIAAIVFTFGMLELANRHSDRRLALGVTLTAVAAVGLALLVQGLVSLLIMGAVVGVAIAGFGAVSNILVLENTPTEYKARMMCFLHSMYGWGSFLGPAVVGLTVGEGARWQTPLLLTLPLSAILLFGAGWLKNEVHGHAAVARKRLDFQQWLAVGIVSAYAGGEVLIATWMVPYLVEAKGISVAGAAPYASAFFFLMGVTRLACVFSVKPKHETMVLFGCLISAIGAYVFGRLGPAWGLPLAGVFGPFFPLFVARVGKAFPAQTRTITLMILGVMEIALGGLHLLVGRLTDVVGIGTAYWLPLGLLTFSLVALLVYIPREREVLS